MPFKPGDKVVIVENIKPQAHDWCKDVNQVFTVIEVPKESRGWGSLPSAHLWLEGMNGWLPPSYFKLKEEAMPMQGFLVGDTVTRNQSAMQSPFYPNHEYEISATSTGFSGGQTLSFKGIETGGWHASSFTIVRRARQSSVPTTVPVEDYFSVDLTDTVDNSNPGLIKLFNEVGIRVEAGNIHEALTELVKQHKALRRKTNENKASMLKFLTDQVKGHHDLINSLDKE